jgi:hypothetical protein
VPRHGARTAAAAALLAGVLALSACTNGRPDDAATDALPAPVETYGGVPSSTTTPCGQLGDAVSDAEHALEAAFAILDGDPQRGLAEVTAAQEAFAAAVADLDDDVAAPAARMVEDRLGALTDHVEGAVSSTPLDPSGITDAVGDVQTAFTAAVNACAPAPSPTS